MRIVADKFYSQMNEVGLNETVLSMSLGIDPQELENMVMGIVDVTPTMLNKISRLLECPSFSLQNSNDIIEEDGRSFYDITNLHNILKAKDITAEELSRGSGVNSGRISSYVRGIDGNANWTNASKIANFLGVATEELGFPYYNEDGGEEDIEEENIVSKITSIEVELEKTLTELRELKEMLWTSSSYS